MIVYHSHEISVCVYVACIGYFGKEEVLIKQAKRAGKPLPYKGYGYGVDVYAAGMVLGQLVFKISEDDVANLDKSYAKGDAFLLRIYELSSAGLCDLSHHLMMQLLNPDPTARISVEDALKHPWLHTE